jgi:hypothetical protein
MSNPFANWKNDDLLMGEEFRRDLEKTNKPLFDILDWPELREKFARHEVAAKTGKKTSRLQGLISIAAAGAGVMLLSAMPALPHQLEGRLSLIALGLMSGGGLLGLLHWLMLNAKLNWLANRFWTERLRQFYFQSLVSSLDVCVAAMTDKAALAALKAKRAEWLADFYVYPNDPRDRMGTIRNDRTETGSWLRPEWRVVHTPKTHTPELDTLLGALHRQRIYIQSYYAKLNLSPSLYVPSTRARLLQGISHASTVLIVFASIVGWIGYFTEADLLGTRAVTWASVAAVLGAIGLIARAANEGLQNEADTDRYEWYAEALEELDERYEKAGIAGRVKELRAVEELSYKEMRRFLRTHDTARFLL